MLHSVTATNRAGAADADSARTAVVNALPSSPPPPVVRPLPPPPPLPLAATFARSTRPRVSRSGATYLVRTGQHVVCQAGGARCTASLVATLVTGRGRAAQRRPVRLGSATQRIAAGRRAEVRFRLTRAAARRLRRTRRLRGRLVLTVRKAGFANATRRATITIVRPRARRRRGR
jgi:hypothetical protein